MEDCAIVVYHRAAILFGYIYFVFHIVLFGPFRKHSLGLAQALVILKTCAVDMGLQSGGRCPKPGAQTQTLVSKRPSMSRPE